VNPSVRIELIDSPEDPRLLELSALMNMTFADPNTVLGVERLGEFLAANGPAARRRFCVLVATRNGAVVGGSVFSYVVRSNCGFSEYLVADRAVRGTGIGRQLFDARKEVLDGEARRFGHAACRGLFIEVDSPDRTPPELRAAERETALDEWDRLRLFEHLGFRRVEVPYTQPPLAPDKQPIDYLDLLFAPWPGQAVSSESLPREWIVDTLEAIWSAWSPATAATALETFKQSVANAHVRLRPLASRPG
jgi:GNAT superfamily N-acetyltransferase